MENAPALSYEESQPRPIHRKLMKGTFMGMIADGYVLGIVGISISYATKPLGLTDFWLGVIGSMSMFGIFFGSLIGGILCDRIGRRPVFLYILPITLLLSLWQFFLDDPLLLSCARFLLGMAVGIDYSVGITLLNEWAPTKKKAFYLAWLLVVWTVGYCIAYMVGFCIDMCASGLGDNAWRYIISTSAIPALLGILLRFNSPESPKWLSIRGRSKEALDLIHRYIGPEYGEAAREEAAVSASWFALFSPKQWRKTLVSGIFFFAQVLPFFAISIFIPMVLEALNFESPHASGVLYNIFTLVGVLIGVPLVSLLSRRFFLQFTFLGSAAALAVLILWKSMPPAAAIVVVSAFALIISLSITLEFLYPAELFPTELRGSGVGLTITISRFGAGGGTFLLPVISGAWGMDAALWVCFATLIFGAVICQMWAPETNPRYMRKGS